MYVSCPCPFPLGSGGGGDLLLGVIPGECGDLRECLSEHEGAYTVLGAWHKAAVWDDANMGQERETWWNTNSKMIVFVVCAEAGGGHVDEFGFPSIVSFRLFVCAVRVSYCHLYCTVNCRLVRLVLFRYGWWSV